MANGIVVAEIQATTPRPMADGPGTWAMVGECAALVRIDRWCKISCLRHLPFAHTL